MNLGKRIEVLVQLGEYISEYGDYLQAVVHRTEFNNLWFTKGSQKTALFSIAEQFLRKEKLEEWVKNYEIPSVSETKNIGLVLAGNIPLVGFHDVLSVFISGHKSIIKLSDKDAFLLPHLVDKLKSFAPESAEYFEFTDRLGGFDAVIATGSNNSARYFDAYFGKYPHIIRRNRNGVAVLTGTETAEKIRHLGQDIFQYYGLGCRNISKIYLPEGYDFNLLMETLHEYKDIVLNNKYKNNFDYNFALFQLNGIPIVNNGCLILIEDKSIISRISVIHYEFYSDKKVVEEDLKNKVEEIQLVVSDLEFDSVKTKKFGEAQQPTLMDYADGVDTLEWLVSL